MTDPQRKLRDFPTLMIAALGVGLGACQNDAPTHSDTPVQVEDSADVRIVEYMGTPVADAPFRFQAEPLYRHGTRPGDYNFQRMSAGGLFPDGTAVVADAFNSEIIVLNADGSTYEMLAGPGEGPGEVNYVQAIFPVGQDSVWVSDPFQGRLTLFARGSVVQTVDMRRAGGLGVKGIGSSGQALLTTSSFRSGFEEEWLPGHMTRLDMKTGVIDTVASYYYVSRPPRGLRWDPIGVGGMVTVADGQFVYTRSDRPEITWHREDGTITQIMRWQAEASPLTEELLDGIEAGMREANQMANPGASDADINRMTDENMATYRARVDGPMPLFGRPFVDAESRVWLPSWRPGPAREGASHYSIVSADGEWLGTVEAPPRLRILHVAGGLVLGAELDDQDVESVAVYEMVGG